MPPNIPAPIRRLEEAVVNRIAAGEVFTTLYYARAYIIPAFLMQRVSAGLIFQIIHRPANALKELIENSLDAGSNSIQIIIKDGGMKLLQIQDNGNGIRRDDLPIVCERFTTSKIRSFDDLSNIATYGFRGEALASVSHIAHVTITTKTADSKCAWRASYSDGKLVSPRPGVSADPKPTAGNNGTQITVSVKTEKLNVFHSPDFYINNSPAIQAEDLFYNVPARRKALKNPSDEYSRILDVVQRYAVHNAGVSFTCKKQGSNLADVHTPTGVTVADVIRQIYGATVAAELLYLEQELPELEIKFKAWISNANYNIKKMVMLLFINRKSICIRHWLFGFAQNRSVESANFKKTIENIYANLLPKNTHPFIYLSLEISPRSVDVNVHPTKREVHLLNEETIVAAVCGAIQDRLKDANSSRTYLTQTLLPGASTVNEADKECSKERSGETLIVYSSSSNPNVPEYNHVRADSRTRTLDDFLRPSDISIDKSGTARAPSSKKMRIEEPNSVVLDEEDVNMGSAEDLREEIPQDSAIEEQNNMFPLSANSVTSRPIKRNHIEVRLTSVLNLRKEVKLIEHSGLTDLFTNHVFVGCIDDMLALVQYQTKLYMINYVIVSEELFYQLVLRNFCNFGFIHLSSAAPIKEFIQIALEQEARHGWDEGMKPMHEIAQSIRRSYAIISSAIVETLISRREMLLEYFSIRISDEGNLLSLPMILKGYVPNLDKLPMFLLRLGSEVDWDSEKGCFESLARELSILYAAEPPTLDSEQCYSAHSPRTEDISVTGESATPPPTMLKEQELKSSPVDGSNGVFTEYRWQVEHLIFPALKVGFIAPNSLAESSDGYVVQLANLSDMYKVFERC
ncbi:DNA mismatch repair protein Mlh1-like protein [Jimgerdemannia flammicorona]|uniref:DNA mismatch repair protein Mlh1-like protein n=1 Tax=Jimgerdemannia flammicorona TaxID=994334 RepID=A0A433D3S0_9FUNG|nr:DNA mismatch repair protein Mlh1-like protein [Jimgerdemannia flammicorona]